MQMYNCNEILVDKIISEDICYKKVSGESIYTLFFNFHGRTNVFFAKT